MEKKRKEKKVHWVISRVASQLKTELIRCFRALGWRVKFWIQKSLGKKKLGIQRILGGKIESKKFIQEKYWVKKKIGPQNNFGLTKIWIPKHFGSQKMFDPKQFCVKKVLGQKESWIQK